MIRQFSALTVFLVFFSSCSIAKFAKYYAGADQYGDTPSGSLHGLYYEGPHTSYIIGQLPSTWQRIAIKGGDLAFLQTRENSTITVNSTCGKNKVKYSLSALSNSLLIGIDDKKLIKSTEREVSGEISLQRIYQGRISGVAIEICTVVLKRGDCVYDLSYSSTPDNFDKWFGEFDEFVSGFKVMS